METLALQLGRHGLLLVFLNVFLEQAGLPIPATPALIVCGAAAAEGKMSASLVLLTALVASLVPDTVWYALGKRRGRRILKTICRVSLNPQSCVRRTERLFDRYGSLSIAFAKLIPGFSTVAPPLAGAMGVGPVRFLLATSLGGVLWAGGAVAIGWIFHGAIEQALAWLASLGFWGAVLAGGGAACFIAFKWWQRRRFYKLLRLSRIRADELRGLLDEGKDVLIFDVRTDAGRRHDPRRIPGAVVLQAEDPESLDSKLASLPKGRDIVLYCT